jgi:phosphatidylserine/phosphatidylglycerophosphate/cardiolipin synthase-like enzyme
VREESASDPLRHLREAAAGAAPSVEVQSAPELRAEGLAALCVSEEIDLIVLGPRTLTSATSVAVHRKQPTVSFLWIDPAQDSRPIQHIACIALDTGSRTAMGAFLKDHTDSSMRVTLLSLPEMVSDVLAYSLDVSGTRATVEVAGLIDEASIRRWLDESSGRGTVDLTVVARVPRALVLSAVSTAPVLLIPPAEPWKGQRSIDVADLVDDGGPLRVRVDHVATVGNLAPVAEGALGFVSKGSVVATVTVSAGEAELPAGLGVSLLGVYRAGAGVPADPLAAVEHRIAVIRPGDRPLVLFDAELAVRVLQTSTEPPGPSAPEPLAVRLRPTRSCRSIRQRLRAAGLPPRVVDARAVLNEGEALDISAAFDPLRLARVASRMQRAGFRIAGIVHDGPAPPLVEGVRVLPGYAVGAGAETSGTAVSSSSTLDNHVEIEFDNATARGWLLDAIAGSRATLNLQFYMGQDDEIGRAVEASLAAAGKRGVMVRVLVDSLHSLHGSFGTNNPLFERLSTHLGVELRSARPITELPSLADLKQRDHRKLVIADGRLALIGGRNLSHEYYTSFEEVELTPESEWRQVPWLDAGARIQGPAVAAISSSFLEAWTDAGGAPFEVLTPPPAGKTAARVVVHRGLRDANTLEAYLELIETARSHVYAINGFPLVLELQHALLRALRRGVRVRTLIGRLTPTHGGYLFGGTWSTARNAATELVHSRMDPIVAAGGEAYIFARQTIPAWARGLGVVHPHVHAKAMSADGSRCAVGSANLDVTASYWESEILLVVEDRGVAGAFEARVDALMAGSTRLENSDPGWQALARRRSWMRYWPSVLSV